VSPGWRWQAPLLPLLALLLCLSGTPPSAAATEGVLDSGGRAALLKEIKERQGSIEAISLSIHQTRDLALLEKPLEIEGRVILKRPNLLRWETTAPERSITVIGVETMTVYRPEEKEGQQDQKCSDGSIN